MTGHDRQSRGLSTFSAWEGIVFDLDGTLIELVVDWPALEDQLADTLREEGIETDGRSSWELLAAARAAGKRDVAESVMAPVESAGARESVRLPLADVVADLDQPVAVCSLNCEEAVRTGLSTHGLSEHVDAVIGRDTFSVWKPDPTPLEEALARLTVEPSRAVFVGDSPRDRTTAERAGVDFRWVEEILSALD